MRSGLLFPASLLAAALAVPFALPARAAILIAIDKTTQQMAVSVDGTQRYVWPVSTGRSGYETPNGTFKPNRMDADHLSQEWDNAPMPHTIFFDMHGHAIHGFFDVKHLGLPVSHGCVRISPDHAAELFALVKTETMKETTVVVSGQTLLPYVAQRNPNAARRRAPVANNIAPPVEIAPRYSQQPQPQELQDPQAAALQQQQLQLQQQQQQQAAPYGQQSYYRQPQPYYGQAQPQPYYGQVQQPYYAQPQSYYYAQPQYYVVRPYNPY
jgi:hypothetical protein